MLMVIPYLVIVSLIEKKRDDIMLFVVASITTIMAAWLASSEAVIKPFYFIFTESFAFRPAEILLHAIPIIILSLIYIHKRMRILIVIATIFGSLIHYNPFFPIFMLYFAGAVTVSEGRLNEHIPYVKFIRNGIMIILIAGFLYSIFDKYYPKHWNYFPRFDERQKAAMDWVIHNASATDVFLALTADAEDIAYVMEFRPVYMGYIGHVAHLGLDWQDRYNATTSAWAGGYLPYENDYLYFGPIEKKYFPDFNTTLPEVYTDSFVTIYRAGQKPGLQ